MAPTGCDHHALQHRWKEGAGIVTSSADGPLREHKGLSLLSGVLAGVLETGALEGTEDIVHNRYSTSGEKNGRKVQPFRSSFREGQVAIAHNGKVTKSQYLSRQPRVARQYLHHKK